MIGQVPQSIYPHLYDLEAAGFLVCVPDTRPTKFRFPWSKTIPDYDDRTGRNAEEADRAIHALLRASTRIFTDRQARLAAREAGEFVLNIEEVTLDRATANDFVSRLRAFLQELRDLSHARAGEPPPEDAVRLFFLAGTTRVLTAGEGLPPEE
jgi:hypothetical protein